jgi:hypothetical protein
MGNKVLGSTPSRPEEFDRISSEVTAALEELKERGVVCDVAETQERGGLTLHFSKGTTSQTIKLDGGNWTQPGTVKSTVLEHLEL